MKKQSQFGSSGTGDSGEYLAKTAAELSLIFCGQEACAPGARYGPRKRDYYTLQVLRSGKGTGTINGVRYDLEAQDMILIFPGMEYLFQADPQAGCSCIWADFAGIRAEACMLHAGFSSGAPRRRIQCIPQLEKVLAAAAQLTAANQLRANGNFHIFLGDLIEEHSPRTAGEALRHTRSPKNSEYVKNAMEYLAKHYQEDIKIQELADLVGINRSYFASSFKKATGCSPKEYLLRLRMERAKYLLETTPMPISSISSAVGYEDPLAFSRIFKRYSRLSPTDYRAQNKSRFY